MTLLQCTAHILINVHLISDEDYQLTVLIVTKCLLLHHVNYDFLYNYTKSDLNKECVQINILK